jgi:LAO/AO transport system kinase
MVAMLAATAYQRGMTGTQPDAAKAAEDLVQRMRAGERNAMARVATEMERLSPSVPALLAAMQPYLGSALVVGITGPPGSGKSTLLNALIAHIRGQGRSIGVIAVDPSSPVSGGAILGDRIRMTSALDDDGVFVRSLASRGYLGGLSPAAVRMLDAFDAAGKEIILVETVGTGQSEIDIVDVTDVRVIVAAPGLGDDIQAMKAGLLEIADILVVNKADRPDARQLVRDLRNMLLLGDHSTRMPPIVPTIATETEGIARLVDEIAAHRQYLDESGTADDRVRQRLRREVAQFAREQFNLWLVDRLCDPENDAVADRLLRRENDPGSVADRLLDDFRAARQPQSN